MSSLVRGRVYRARPTGFNDDKFFVVVSNNSRNRQLDSVLVVRFTTSPKPELRSILEIPSGPWLPWATDSGQRWASTNRKLRVLNQQQ